MELSEEEIIQTLENMLKSWDNIREDCKNSDLSKVIEQIEKENKAIQGLLDLYNKQKEEIENLKNRIANKDKEIKLMKSVNINEEIERNFISKDKIKNTLVKFQNEYGEDLLVTGRLFIGKEVVQYGEDMLDEIAKELDIKLLEDEK